MKPYLVLSCLLLGACTSLPQAMKDAHVADVTYAQVSQNIDSHKDALVRWGGVIIGVENSENLSIIQALFYPLNYFGRPKLGGAHGGLFIIKSPEFLDPIIYTKGKEITVVGILNGGIERTVGKKAIQVPLLLSTATHLWPEYYHKDYYDDGGYSGRYAGFGFGGCGLHTCYGYDSYPVIRGRYYLPYRY